MDSLFNITLNSESLWALGQVLLIDIVLAGDNAVVIGMAAARMAPKDRKKVIFWGLIAAVVLRFLFAVVATQLLAILGLMLAGGVLLLWVSWRLYRELREHKRAEEGYHTIEQDAQAPAATQRAASPTMRRAVINVVIADVSMSLDNVLAVAGVARDHLWVLAAGLLLSIALMGVAATYIAKMLHRWPWISYAGLLLIVYVSIKMIWDGGIEVYGAM